MTVDPKKEKIRILAIRMLAATLRGLVALRSRAPKAFKLISKPLSIFGRFLLFIVVLPLYKFLVFITKYINKFYVPQKSRHRLIHPFSRRYLTHLIIVFVGILTLAANLNAYEIKREEFEQTSIASHLMEPNLGALEREGPADTARKVSRYLGQTGVENRIIGSDEPLEIAPTTVAGDSAVVTPILSPVEAELRQRDKIITYNVQDGDTVSQIAEKFGVSVNTILWENNLTSYQLIKPGDTITILPVSGIRHKVARGDTVSSIAKKYEIEPDKIIEFNKLASVDDINVGESLVVPGGKKIVETPAYAIRTVYPRPSIPSSPVAVAPKVAGSGKMQWPTSCSRITQYFRWAHTGVDIACKFGSPIYAADSGTVIKAQGGFNGGYGTMVLVDHGGGTVTLYGHMSSLSVKVGQTVDKGDYLGAMGSTGRSTGSHVHFEVRESGSQKNPLYYVN